VICFKIELFSSHLQDDTLYFHYKIRQLISYRERMTFYLKHQKKHKHTHNFELIQQAVRIITSGL